MTNIDDNAAPKVGNHNSDRTWSPPETYRRGEPAKLQVAEEEALQAIVDLGGGPVTTNEVAAYLYSEGYDRQERMHAASAINRLKNKGQLERVDQVPSEKVSGGFEARYAVVDMPAAQLAVSQIQTSEEPEPEPEPAPEPVAPPIQSSTIDETVLTPLGWAVPPPIQSSTPAAPPAAPEPEPAKSEPTETESSNQEISKEDQILQIVRAKGTPVTIDDVATAFLGQDYAPKERKFVANAIMRLVHKGYLETGDMIPRGRNRLMTYHIASKPVEPAPTGTDNLKDRILDIMRAEGRPIMAGSVGRAIGINAKAAGLYLANLQKQGLVRRVDRSRWEVGSVPGQSVTDPPTLIRKDTLPAQDRVAQTLKEGPLRTAQIVDKVFGPNAGEKERKYMENGITRALKKGLIKVIGEECTLDGRNRIKTYASADYQAPETAATPQDKLVDVDFKKAEHLVEEHLQAELALADLRARFKPLDIEPLPNLERTLIQLRGVVDILRNLGCAQVLPDDFMRLADWVETVNEQMQRR